MSDPTLTVCYDHLAFGTEEIAAMQREFAYLAPLRLRPLYKERGGDWTTLSIVLTYIGLKLADGLLENAGAAIRRKTIEVIRRVVFRCPDSSRPAQIAQNVCLVSSFDDADLELNLPLDTTHEYVEHLWASVLNNLREKPLSEAHVSRVVIPFAQSTAGWHQVFEWYHAEHLDRYWGIHLRHNPCVCDVYDSQERCFLHLGYDAFTDDHDGRGSLKRETTVLA